jgi:FkbM family methyltransferase
MVRLAFRKIAQKTLEFLQRSYYETKLRTIGNLRKAQQIDPELDWIQSRGKDGFELHLQAAGEPRNTQTVDLEGLKWTVPQDQGLGTRILTQRKLPVEKVRRWSELRLGGGEMVDIGANIGTISIPAIQLGVATRIYAIEPELNNYSCLCRNIFDNSLADVIFPSRVAISSFNGTAEMKVGANIGTHRLLAHSTSPSASGNQVVCVTLEVWGRRNHVDWRRVKFIKVDAQGAEGHILQGARAILQMRYVVWQIEFWPKGIAALGQKVKNVYGLLNEYFKEYIDTGKGLRDSPRRPIESLRRYWEARYPEPSSFADLILFPR